MAKNRLTSISLSGIDGCGKTSVAHELCRVLKRRGLDYRYVAFYRRTCAGLLSAVAAYGVPKAQRRVVEDQYGMSTSPSRHTKAALLAKAVFPWFDIVLYHAFFPSPSRKGPTNVVFDRHFFDHLVQLQYCGLASSRYLRLLLSVVPRAHHRIWIECDPATAHRRNPEYPLSVYLRKDSLYRNLARAGYLIPVSSTGRDAVLTAEAVLHTITGSGEQR